MKAAIVMGSDSDLPVVRPAIDILREFGIEVMVEVASAHRTPERLKDFINAAAADDVAVFIAAAGAAAHLGGVIASHTTKPVIGIPVNATSLGGIDALLSTVQMPSGIPVAAMGVNGAKNAGIFAAQIIAVANPAVAQKLQDYRAKLAAEVDVKAARVKEQLKK